MTIPMAPNLTTSLGCRLSRTYVPVIMKSCEKLQAKDKGFKFGCCIGIHATEALLSFI
jgi:hypothetical protein